MFVALAYASTGTGIETAMTNLTNMVIAICGLGVVVGIGWKGLQFVIMQDWRHAGESLIGVGLGGGMVAFARPIGTFIMGAALANPRHAGTPLAMSDGWSDLVALALYQAPLLTLGWALCRRVTRHGR